MLIFSTTNYEKPLKCVKQPSRILNILSSRDIYTTLSIGSILGYIVNNSFFKGIIIEFLIGQVIHIIFNVSTMPLYLVNISDKPNGTGFIPNCIS